MSPTKRPERGSTAVEYALVMTLVATAAVGGFVLFGEALEALFNVSLPTP